MKRLWWLPAIFALACVGLYLWMAHLAKGLQTLDVKGPDPAAVARTAKEIEQFNAESAALQAAVDRRLASWYGKECDGKKTSNGEIYDRWAPTCASLDYPKGTWLKIVDVKTRRWVIVRVNDSGPYVPGRSIDLSEGAAHQLGMRERGVAVVEVKVLEVKP
jgi:rare lipoprotein A (peptidoglycan hydrolase)